MGVLSLVSHNDGESVSAQRRTESDAHSGEGFSSQQPAESNIDDGINAAKSHRRPRRSAKARREQHMRANARVVQKVLQQFAALEHRGCRPTRLGAAFATALQATPPFAPASFGGATSPRTTHATVDRQHMPVCRHWLAGRCSWGNSCRFAHTTCGDDNYGQHDDYNNGDARNESYNNNNDVEEDNSNNEGYGGHDDVVYVNEKLGKHNIGGDKGDNAQRNNHYDYKSDEAGDDVTDIIAVLNVLDDDSRQHVIKRLTTEPLQHDSSSSEEVIDISDHDCTTEYDQQDEASLHDAHEVMPQLYYPDTGQTVSMQELPHTLYQRSDSSHLYDELCIDYQLRCKVYDLLTTCNFNNKLARKFFGRELHNVLTYDIPRVHVTEVGGCTQSGKADNYGVGNVAIQGGDANMLSADIDARMRTAELNGSGNDSALAQPKQLLELARETIFLLDGEQRRQAIENLPQELRNKIFPSMK